MNSGQVLVLQDLLRPSGVVGGEGDMFKSEGQLLSFEPSIVRVRINGHLALETSQTVQ